MAVLNGLFSRFKKQTQAIAITRIDNVRQLIELLADDAEGTKVEIDFDVFSEAVERSGFSEADLQANVELLLKRRQQAKVAERMDELSKAATEAEKAFNAADLAEGKRRHEARLKLIEMEDISRLAMLAADGAMEAESDLHFSADTSHEEQKLTNEMTALNKQITKLQVKLDPHPYRVGRPGTPAVGEHPAALVLVCKHDLKEARKGSLPPNPERIKQIKRSLEIAETAVAEAVKEMSSLEKKRDTLSAKSASLVDLRLVPENFALVRSNKRLPPDEQRKQYAREIGFHDGPVVTHSFGVRSERR